jgi:hypothetical protein
MALTIGWLGVITIIVTWAAFEFLRALYKSDGPHPSYQPESLIWFGRLMSRDTVYFGLSLMWLFALAGIFIYLAIA